MNQNDQPTLPPDSPLMTMTNSFLNDDMLLLSMPGPSRDPSYYIHDGNSVLLVENTLFKVRIQLQLGGEDPDFDHSDPCHTLGASVGPHQG